MSSLAKKLAGHSSLQTLDGERQSMIDKVVEICNMNSGTLNLAGLARVQDLLANFFAPFNVNHQVVNSKVWQTIGDRGEIQNHQLGKILHWTCRPTAPFRVLLCIHYDTVYGVDHQFQHCRWLDESTLNGPGVADAKGGIIVLLHALQAFERTELAEKIGWEVVLNPDEEIGSPGSSEFISSCAARCHAGLLFEPSMPGGTLVSWRKGSGNFTIIVNGRSAHAGRDFAEGRNAVLAASRLAIEFDALNGQNDDVTINVGWMFGGGAVNIVPDSCVLRVNARVRTSTQQLWVNDHFKQIVDRANATWEGIRVEIHGDFYSPPKTLDEPTEDLQRRIERCGDLMDTTIQWQGSGGASDGNRVHAAGLPNIDSLGPIGGRIHSPDEFLLVDSLVTRAKLAALILLSFAADQNA
ncbi:MAG TPA: hydrolase [Pirellulaceae bacterium]|nr:hydrolase [Pirellulaceae bacterium]HMO91485.1 hydrolase [Pirellulaceae bacterium]HMP70998.1 hydrolase [Pirellulaceae bacterium]